MDLEITVDDDSSFGAVGKLRERGIAIGSSGAMAVVGGLRAAEQLGIAAGRILVIVADDGWYETVV